MGPIAIIDRGRGPVLAGTRITVFDILPYLEAGHSPTYIAAVLRLSTPEVEALIRYIEEHREEVLAENQKIDERIARGNPPEVEARLPGSRARLIALRDELRRQALRGETNGTGDPGGR
jgi:uncharacterized protein (DUF433 family)